MEISKAFDFLIDLLVRRQESRNHYQEDKGKTIWGRNRACKGIVTRISSRYCAGCQGNNTCYIVRWEDGRVTKPCTAGVKPDGNDLIII